MKNLAFIILTIVVFYKYSYSQQNLVLNPSFEDFTICPDNTNQVERATGWFNFGNTPDYFHVCSSNIVSIPLNAFGYQLPASGQAYCGLGTYYNSSYREIIGTELISPLITGTTYYISYKINYSHDTSIYYNCVASNKLGVKFSNTFYSEFAPFPIDNISHVYSNSIITDTLGWFRVIGIFTPSINYQYLMIGNFFDNLNTDTLMFCSLNVSSYYFLDDICVSTDSAFAYNYTYTGISAESFSNQILLYPNPTSNSNGISISSPEVINKYTIYSALGSVIQFDSPFTNNIFIGLSDYSKGIYYITITTNKLNYTKKFIIN